VAQTDELLLIVSLVAAKLHSGFVYHREVVPPGNSTYEDPMQFVAKAHTLVLVGQQL
jgi:hypothetical protein